MKKLFRGSGSDAGSSVLFDAPGPVTRRRVRMFSVVAGLGVLALLGWAGSRLADQGQFESDKWAPLFDPSNSDFADVWNLLGQGLVHTLTAAGLAITLSLVLGTVIGVARLSAGKVTRPPIIAFIELFRGLPVILTIYLSSRVLPELGIDVSVLPGGELLWFLVIGLTAYNCVIFAEIIRSGVVSLPKGQGEAALATGLTKGQSMRLVLLPQAFRVMLPALISQTVVVLKDTSLIAILGGYIELLKQGGLLIQNLNNPIQTYLLIAVIFIVLNYTLGKFAEWLQRRLSRSTSGGDIAAPTVAAA
ncbi:MAG: amino acid ABC transporter permease [Mycobacteriaceae bacterium]